METIVKKKAPFNSDCLSPFIDSSEENDAIDVSAFFLFDDERGKGFSKKNPLKENSFQFSGEESESPPALIEQNRKELEKETNIATMYFRDMGKHNLIDSKKEKEIYRKISLRKTALVRIIFQIPIVQKEIFRLEKEIPDERFDIRKLLAISREKDISELKKVKNLLLATIRKARLVNKKHTLHSNAFKRSEIADLFSRFVWNNKEIYRLVEIVQNAYRKINQAENNLNSWKKETGVDAQDFEEIIAGLLIKPRELDNLTPVFHTSPPALDELEKLVEKRNLTISQVERDVGLSPDELSRYVNGINRLINKNQRDKDLLIESNLRLVVKLAQRYTNRGLHLLDLIQEGNIGLIKAVERFEYERGNKFSTYASWWIRQSINRAIADQSRTVRVPVHLTETLDRYVKTRQALSKKLEREPLLDEIAAEMNLPIPKLINLQLLSSLALQPISLETPIGDDENSTFGEFVESKKNPDLIQEISKKEKSQEVRKVLSILSPREEKVIRMRFGIDEDGEYTLEEVGKNFGLTRERIRQIEKEALNKLTACLNFDFDVVLHGLSFFAKSHQRMIK